MISTTAARNFYRNLAQDFFGGFDGRLGACDAGSVDEVVRDFKVVKASVWRGHLIAPVELNAPVCVEEFELR